MKHNIEAFDLKDSAADGKVTIDTSEEVQIVSDAFNNGTLTCTPVDSGGPKYLSSVGISGDDTFLTKTADSVIGICVGLIGVMLTIFFIPSLYGTVLNQIKKNPNTGFSKYAWIAFVIIIGLGGLGMTISGSVTRIYALSLTGIIFVALFIFVFAILYYISTTIDVFKQTTGIDPNAISELQTRIDLTEFPLKIFFPLPPKTQTVNTD
jgi:hypothetical protein